MQENANLSHTSPSAIFCLDWMNAGSTGKIFSNATLSLKIIFRLEKHIVDTMFLHLVVNFVS